MDGLLRDVYRGVEDDMAGLYENREGPSVVAKTFWQCLIHGIGSRIENGGYHFDISFWLPTPSPLRNLSPPKWRIPFPPLPRYSISSIHFHPLLLRFSAVSSSSLSPPSILPSNIPLLSAFVAFSLAQFLKVFTTWQQPCSRRYETPHQSPNPCHPRGRTSCVFAFRETLLTDHLLAGCWSIGF